MRDNVGKAVAAITGCRVRAVNVTVDRIHEEARPKSEPKPEPLEPDQKKDASQ